MRVTPHDTSEWWQQILYANLERIADFWSVVKRRKWSFFEEIERQMEEITVEFSQNYFKFFGDHSFQYFFDEMWFLNEFDSTNFISFNERKYRASVDWDVYSEFVSISIGLCEIYWIEIFIFFRFQHFSSLFQLHKSKSKFFLAYLNIRHFVGSVERRFFSSSFLLLFHC